MIISLTGSNLGPCSPSREITSGESLSVGNTHGVDDNQEVAQQVS